jgi:outer membrane protein assembly factor BamA
VDKVDITVEDNAEIEKAQLVNYLRQTPNHKVLGFLKLQLATYNMSGRDSTKWYNRWMRRLGQAPVLYSQELTDASVYQLHQAMLNKGYLNADVTVDTIHTSKNRKVQIDYRIRTGRPHYIATIDYAIPDTAIASLVARMPRRERLKPGDLLDRNRLEEIRTSISEMLRNNGYYAFSKDYITFVADTAAGARDVNLTLTLHQPSAQSADKQHITYIVNKVVYVTDYNPGTDYGKFEFSNQDTVRYRDIDVLYGNDRYLRPQVLYEALHIAPGKPFCQRDVDRTYESLGRFGILRYVNINMQRVGTSPDGHPLLDAYVLLTRGKKQGVSLELEGTNSEGDLGFGVGVTYQHRNLAHGSELLSAKFRTSYESLSGDFNGLINNRYMEYAGEVGITFPQFEAPFLSYDFKRRIKATTEFSISGNYQERPEYTRIIAGAGWKYRWTNRQNTLRHRFDLIDVNYVYLPNSTIDFLNQIAPTNPLLRYSYEDHFILRSGYSYYRTNKRQPSENSLTRMMVQPSVFTIRANFEPAGNLLYAISRLTGQNRHDGAYRVFGIQYSQYMKADADYTFTRVLGPRTSVSFHAGLGLGVPYGNSQMLPFEKRFYAGGANSVRGWGVRTLGPGRYASKNSVSDFINQCGDIRLDLNIEYRAKLFWILEGALFIDGGNIWTIHNYENQPGGFFRFNSFYKELAAAYGMGLRLDFTYFLLRLDLGMKAVNPALDEYQWPIIHPRWGRDATIHFSVGYPF